MPTYLYQVIHEDGSEGETFEVVQSMKEKSLERHPETGEPVRRVFSAPHIGSASTSGLLSDKNIEEKGFTRYQRAGHGQYEKTAGREGPETLGL